MRAQLSLLAGSGADQPSVIEPLKHGRSCGLSPRLPVGEALRRARAADPDTSHQAAEGAAAFAGSHCARIVKALATVANATPHELTKHTGLTVVQIDRRLPELEREGRARVVFVGGKPLQRGGFRVWERT